MWRSSFGTHSLTCVAHEREREKELWLEKKEDQSFGFYLLSFWGIYIEEDFAGFFPLGFSQDKSLFSFCMVFLVYLSVIQFICFCYEIEMRY